ncbi:MAG: MmcQ/YjbR family DNA-binding protein [Thermomicrobiales bacterium]
MPTTDEILSRVRELSLALPETTERLSHGSPSFFIRGKKCFVMFLDNHHDDGRLALWCAAPDGVQRVLVESQPEHYFLPPYVGHMGWVGVHLNHGIDDADLAAIITDAYLTKAPPKLAARAIDHSLPDDH